MDSLVFSEQNTRINDLTTSYTIPILESGLNCLQQEQYIEGAALLVLAREHLLPHQIQLIDALDALNKAIASHLQVQQMLHVASKRFAESDAEQQAQIAALKKLLPTIVEDIPTASSTGTQLRHPPQWDQSLRLLRPPAPIIKPLEEYQASSSGNNNTLPTLYITCFGRFEVRRSDPSGSPIDLCSNLKGQAILRYLITQPKHQATVDMLIDVFWPEELPDVACRKLRIAMSDLRCALNKDIVSEAGRGYILCKHQSYALHPSVVLQTDVEEFLALYQAGQKTNYDASAMYYEKACRLYKGPFLSEDLYADWSSIWREELSKIYVAMCGKLAVFNLEKSCYEDAVKWAFAILKVDRCDEEAYRQLMRAYAAQGRRKDVRRQYQRCQRVLDEELGVQPMAETQKLFRGLLNCDNCSV